MKHHHKHGHHMHGHHHAHGQYEHEVEKPGLPHEGHLEHGMGLHSFKDDADPIAYGQAGGPGCKSDSKKIHSQMKEYHWD